MFAVYSEFNKASQRVDYLVNYSVSIVFVTCGKNSNMKASASLLQALARKRTHVYFCSEYVPFSSLYLYFLRITVLRVPSFTVLVTVHQSFVKVKY